MVTPRLTAPQLAVLRALDGYYGWMQAIGAFNAHAAKSLTAWAQAPVTQREGCLPCEFKLTPAGRSLVAQLKAGGKL